MPRLLLCVGVLVGFALPCRAEQTVTGSETLIRLCVTAAAEPKPALRYVLVPGLQEMNPGNPIPNYMKAILEHQKFFLDEEAVGRRESLLVMPLKHFLTDELQDYGERALAQVDEAARLDTPDWQVLLKLKAEGFQLLLPEVQEMRALARALLVRFRYEISLGHFDAAIRTAQTMFAMARHLGAHPTFIGDLVGVAVATVAIAPLEEMLEQPGCPNLYWALTNMPHPLVPLEQGVQGEKALAFAEFLPLSDREPMTADQIQKFAIRWDSTFGMGNSSDAGRRVRAWLDARNKDPAHLGSARRRLVESGLPEERLLRFPADQVILLDEKRELDLRFDDVLKTLALPMWQAEPARARLRQNQPPALFADALEPAAASVHRAQTRLEQRIALLRHVEALRIHAAEHGGIFPARLADVPVPLPDDPFSGRPFRYVLEGETAHLRGSPPAGEEANPVFNFHYEVTLQHSGPPQ